jgi:flagellar protein FliS
MTTMQQQARAAYTAGNLSTASPQKLLLMLWDRLVLDVERGLRAQMANDNEEAGRQLTHAQAIITEFQATLDPEGWDGGHELMALYGYLQRRLVQANVRKDQRATKEVLVHCRALRDTWHKAAQLAARGA